ncbi:uncharacterized protein BX664DRAFT_285516 [Halteromyces radiatus]|uniref:uncharacterized protein n=1 Tax=Halteromyces radiatus TaxID=101107 RepID=UPI002220C522|nr:uncharacterized protein BX664DRAFT_285516 [Halteromyces radiatus]KAI8081468.1 hypothetical protein BX664DRAFT_285516 [Halteromyces radiatus]
MGANGSKDASSRSSSLQSIHFKNKPQEQVDFGTVFPNGLYSTTPQDFDSRILRQLILSKKLSPFYKGLPDAPEQVTAISHLPQLQPSTSLSTLSTPHVTKGRPRSASNRSEKMQRTVEKEPSYADKMKAQKAMLYNDAVECPICFLYYPPNINYSRCCDQPICTECFIQIHRPTDDPSSPATCPFCLESNYGITYTAPAWSEKPKRLRSFSSSSSLSTSSSPVISTGARHTTSGVSDGVKPRRKSISHKHPDVVLIDHIRPHWNKPSTTSSTRSSRRNSLTTSNSPGRHLLRAVTRPGRSASSAASTEYNQYLANVRDMNMDLEEWMVMEAIRLSLAEHEEQARNGQQQQEEVETPSTTTSSSMSSSSSSLQSPSIRPQDPSPSTVHVPGTSTDQLDDDDEQPLAVRVQQYQQQTAQEQNRLLSSSPSAVSSTSTSSTNQNLLDEEECSVDKKSSTEHDPTSPTTDIIC